MLRGSASLTPVTLILAIYNAAAHLTLVLKHGVRTAGANPMA